ncbi:unnamed protein product [Linum tenue]|uniref:Uncharacterized protein n=1 Tax=Linum tenue TaxID=586396 RepID=A0AAV0R6Y6_9ROSI|nr:unnamed protein product [Linum tenue]
MSLDLLLP